MAVSLSAFLLFAGMLGPPQALAQNAAAPAASTSQLLRPGLDQLSRELPLLQVERWKLNGALRGQTGADLQSIERDLNDTLPPLLAAADAAPQALSAQLPVSRNVTALYDVLLRVVERGRSAPADQQGALEQARAALDAARRAFDQSLQTTALAQEATLKLSQTPPQATPPPPPPPAKKKAKRKPAS